MCEQYHNTVYVEDMARQGVNWWGQGKQCKIYPPQVIEFDLVMGCMVPQIMRYVGEEFIVIDANLIQIVGD